MISNLAVGDIWLLVGLVLLRTFGYDPTFFLLNFLLIGTNFFLLVRAFDMGYMYQYLYIYVSIHILFLKIILTFYFLHWMVNLSAIWNSYVPFSRLFSAPLNLLVAFSSFIEMFISNYTAAHTQRNLFEVLLNQTKICLYSPFYDWFGPKRPSVCFQISRKMVNKSDFRLI